MLAVLKRASRSSTGVGPTSGASTIDARQTRIDPQSQKTKVERDSASEIFMPRTRGRVAVDPVTTCRARRDRRLHSPVPGSIGVRFRRGQLPRFSFLLSEE